MQSDFEQFFHRAEDHYLQPPEIKDFRDQLGILSTRLETYKVLRDNELVIFQSIAQELSQAFPEDLAKVERGLKHWLSVMNYSATAMLFNRPEFLQHRLLEWLTDIVEVHEMQEVENKLYQSLVEKLPEILSVEQMGLIVPFLEQAYNNLVKKQNDTEKAPLMVGKE